MPTPHPAPSASQPTRCPPWGPAWPGLPSSRELRTSCLPSGQHPNLPASRSLRSPTDTAVKAGMVLAGGSDPKTSSLAFRWSVGCLGTVPSTASSGLCLSLRGLMGPWPMALLSWWLRARRGVTGTDQQGPRPPPAPFPGAWKGQDLTRTRNATGAREGLRSPLTQPLPLPHVGKLSPRARKRAAQRAHRGPGAGAGCGQRCGQRCGQLRPPRASFPPLQLRAALCLSPGPPSAPPKNPQKPVCLVGSCLSPCVLSDTGMPSLPLAPAASRRR